MNIENAHDSKTDICRGHIVQFYNDDRYLTGALAEYIQQGLRRNEAIVVLCSEQHWQQLQILQTDAGSFLPALQSGQIQYFNAEETLRSILDENLIPDAYRFRGLLEDIYCNLRLNYTKVRFYGELVDVLCSQGKIDQALKLESLWNDFLSVNTACSLLCGYSTKNISAGEEMNCVCNIHSRVIPNEDIKALADQNVLYQKISFLELKLAVKGIEQLDQLHEIKHIKRQLLHMGKLSVLGEFSAGLAHEINNPLAIISALVGKIRATPGQPIEQSLDKIDRAVDRMAKIAKTMLRFARQEPLQQQPFYLATAIQDAIELTQDSLNADRVYIHTRVLQEHFQCLGDANIMSQVFMIMFLNSRDAIVSARRTKGLISIETQNTVSGKILITITDNGVGMDEETIHKIFFPFFTTKGAGHGTGLGLSIAFAAIQEHGGTITCTSTVGEGTSFQITVPNIDLLATVA